MVKDFRKNTLQLPDWESKANGSHAIYHSKVGLLQCMGRHKVRMATCQWKVGLNAPFCGR